MLEEYQAPEERPLRSYQTLELVYGASIAAYAMWMRRSGRELPDRIPASDLALLGVATYKGARLISKEKVTSSLRAPFRKYIKDGRGTEVEEEARGEGLQRAVGELLGCPFCIAQWIATTACLGYTVAPRAARIAAAVLTVRAISDLLQYADTAVGEAVERQGEKDDKREQ